MADGTYALIAGGGTAGHVLPAVAIADALVERGHERSSIHYVGSVRGIESTVVPDAGYQLTLLPGRGIQRRLTLANIGATAGIIVAIVRAIGLVRRLRPRVVVAVGGYASVPVALGAVLWRVPIVVAEQNAQPGAANRLVARFAKAAAVSFPGTPLPRSVVTGNPVRQAVLAVDRRRDGEQAKQRLGIEPGRRLVLVVGGSLGALRINEAVRDVAASAWRDRADLSVRHIVGARDWEWIHGDVDRGRLQYEQVRYEHDMALALAAADLAVCRSGSSTCFELAAAALPAVLVPSPFVTADHQSANARHLEAVGAAVVVPDAELTPERVAKEVDSLLADTARLEAMTSAARSLAAPHAAGAIAALAKRHAR